MKLSVIIPCNNEESNIEKLYSEICDVLKDIKYEIIFVDDGSTDDTYNMMKECYLKDKKHIKVLSFSRKYSKESAMLAGLDYSSGDYTCFIDGNLSQNPRIILDMMDFLDNNIEYDIVSMIKTSKNNTFIKFMKKIYFKLLNYISDVHYENGECDFKMFRTNVKTSIINMREKSRCLKSMVPYVGFNVKYIPYVPDKRKKVKKKFNLINCIDNLNRRIVNCTDLPFKLVLLFGIFLLILSFIYFVLALIVNDFSFILFLILNLFGIQFLIMYMFGMYIYNVQIECKKRPVYIIKESLGIDE